MKVIVACEESQTVCKAFRARGHEAYSCDIQLPSGGHPEWHILGDAVEALGGGVRKDNGHDASRCRQMGFGYMSSTMHGPGCKRCEMVHGEAEGLQTAKSGRVLYADVHGKR